MENEEMINSSEELSLDSQRQIKEAIAKKKEENEASVSTSDLNEFIEMTTNASRENKKTQEEVESTEEEMVASILEEENPMRKKCKEFLRGKKIKLVAAAITGAAVIAGIITGVSSCSKSNDKKESDDNLNSITSDDSLVSSNPIEINENESTVTLPSSHPSEETSKDEISKDETSKDEISKDETGKNEPTLEDFATIKYIDEKEFVTLLKEAEQQFEGTSVTTEELCAFVYTINSPVINDKLENVLIETGVISDDAKLVRQNYLNTIDKTRDAMYYAKTYETANEIDEELGKEYKEHAKAIHVSKMVSKNSSEYKAYKILDKAYDKIGDAKTVDEAKETYITVWGYANSIYGDNMPNNVEEEIYKDLYNITYDLIINFNLNASVNDFVYNYEDTETCSNVYNLR